jgi:hypothetical protein
MRNVDRAKNLLLNHICSNCRFRKYSIEEAWPYCFIKRKATYAPITKYEVNATKVDLPKEYTCEYWEPLK